MALSIEEQEVNVSFTRANGRASIYVSDTRYINKLNKLVEKSDEWKIEHEERLQSTGELLGITYSCPIELISFKSKKRKLSDEEKAKRAEILRRNIARRK